MDKINEVLTRRVEKIYPSREAFEKVLRSGKKISLYLGIDPTGVNLHLGHAIPLMKLQEFVELGHHVIFLVGNFTALCGDPSGHEKTRKSLSQKEIEKNMVTYKKQASKILNFTKAELKYNAEWLSKLTFAKIIKLASNFTVQQMIERDLFQRRIKDKKPIFLHEFLYPLLQGYDAVAMNVDLQVGGSDQTFNMLAGRTLQKIINNKEMFVLTTKMVIGLDGKMMSKTSGNTINILDSPSDIYGKVMSMVDELIIEYFEMCTNVSLQTIEEHKKLLKANPMNLKKKLAWELVKIYHGVKAADEAQKNFEQVFQKRKLPEEGITTIHKLSSSATITDALVEAGTVSSRSEAKRLITQGSVDINDQTITDPQYNQISNNSIIKVGKRKFIKISVNQK